MSKKRSTKVRSLRTRRPNTDKTVSPLRMVIEEKIGEAKEAIRALEQDIIGEDAMPILREAVKNVDSPAAHGSSDVNQPLTDVFDGCIDGKEAAKKAAAERARKVETGLAVKQLINQFQSEVAAQLATLSGKIESQLSTLVTIVASIAVTKNQLKNELGEFELSMRGLLDLNDELDPIEIADLFGDRGEFADDFAEDPEVTKVTDGILAADNGDLSDVISFTRTQ
jgi:hypothetical protein